MTLDRAHPIKSPDRWSLELLATVIAITAVRGLLVTITLAQLGPDEAQYWSWSRELAFGYFTKPPLIAWLIRAETELCGDGAACVRAAAPLFHALTALIVADIARRLHSAEAGFWAGLLYLTGPGTSISAFLLTTDVPLLFSFALGLNLFIRFLDKPSPWLALAYGVTVGIGLNAKYAMAFLPAANLLYLVLTPSARAAVLRRASLPALAGLVLIAPNLIWNAAHDFATIAHTADDAQWSARLRPDRFLEFFGAQFGVAGPVAFAGILLAVFVRRRGPEGAAERLLLAHCLPILAIFCAQAFVSRANPNWAATAYPAGFALAAIVLVATRRGLWLRIGLGVNLVVMAVLALFAVAGTPDRLPAAGIQARQLFGWAETGAELARRAEALGIERVVTRTRALTAGMVYALKDRPLVVEAFMVPGDPPADGFQQSRPWTADLARPALVLSPSGFAPRVAEALCLTPIEPLVASIYLAENGRMPLYRFDPGCRPAG